MSTFDKELKETVQKSSDQRLQDELKTGQNFFNESQIMSMCRADVLGHVMTLRKLSGSNLSVKALIPQFKPDEKADPDNQGGLEKGPKLKLNSKIQC